MGSSRSNHHYAFVHRALREASLHHPLAVLAALASAQRDEFLDSLLASVDEHEGTVPPRDFSLADIKVHCVRIGRNPCAIVEMPKPAGPAEGYFAAILVRTILNDDPTEDELAAAQIGYYVLERPAMLLAPADTMLCGWDLAGNHQNYGRGPAPELHAFKASLERFTKHPEGA